MTENQQKNLSATVAELLEAIGKRQLGIVSPNVEVNEIIATFARAEHTRLIYGSSSVAVVYPSFRKFAPPFATRLPMADFGD